MPYLLDTHTFLWDLSGDPLLSARSAKLIEDDPQGRYLSIVSFWEIGIKLNVGKLDIAYTIDQLWEHALRKDFRILTVSFEDTKLISTLPLHHRDPFDRMIIAQSINHNLSIISRDEHFSSYDTKIIW